MRSVRITRSLYLRGGTAHVHFNSIPKTRDVSFGMQLPLPVHYTSKRYFFDKVFKKVGEIVSSKKEERPASDPGINRMIDDATAGITGVKGFLFRTALKTISNKIAKDSAVAMKEMDKFKHSIDMFVKTDSNFKRHFGNNIGDVKFNGMNIGEVNGKVTFEVVCLVNGDRETGLATIRGGKESGSAGLHFDHVTFADTAGHVILDKSIHVEKNFKRQVIDVQAKDWSYCLIY